MHGHCGYSQWIARVKPSNGVGELQEMNILRA